MQETKAGQDGLYQQAAREYGAALGRLAYAYEADPDRRRDLVQEIQRRRSAKSPASARPTSGPEFTGSSTS